MRIAVLSDIHGNLVALDAVLADLRANPADRVVCLGDAVQGGPQPGETVARLRELGCPVIMGNADAWLVTGRAAGAEAPSPAQNDVREWALSRLEADDRSFIAAFPATLEFPLEAGRTCLCFHGSPNSFDDLILPLTSDEALRRLLDGVDHDVTCGGHTHVQHIRHLGPRIYFNPGSVGYAFRPGQEASSFRADPWAEYAVLTSEGERLALEFRRVPFDLNALLSAYRLSGRPHAEAAIANYIGRP